MQQQCQDDFRIFEGSAVIAERGRKPAGATWCVTFVPEPDSTGQTHVRKAYFERKQLAIRYALDAYRSFGGDYYIHAEMIIEPGTP